MNHDLHYLFQNKLKSFNKRKGGKGGGVWGGWLEFQNKFRDLIQIHIAVFLPSIQQYDYNPEHSETSIWRHQNNTQYLHDAITNSNI